MPGNLLDEMMVNAEVPWTARLCPPFWSQDILSLVWDAIQGCKPFFNTCKPQCPKDSFRRTASNIRTFSKMRCCNQFLHHEYSCSAHCLKDSFQKRADFPGCVMQLPRRVASFKTVSGHTLLATQLQKTHNTGANLVTVIQQVRCAGFW